MKNYIKTICGLLILIMSLSACTSNDARFASIKGKFDGDLKGKQVHLNKVEHGTKKLVATTEIGLNGDFGFNYAVAEPGLYVVNIVKSDTHRNVDKDHDLKRFYLDNGTDIELQMTEGKYQLLQTNSDKNKLLSQWNSQIDSVFTYTNGFKYNLLDYTHFFPLLPSFIEQKDAFLQNINTGDADFDELMKLMVDTDMSYAALKMIYTPRVKRPERKDYPEFYDMILTDKQPDSERLLELPYGRSFLSIYAMYAVFSQADRPSTEQYFETCLDVINNDLLKGYYAIDNIRQFRSFDSRFLGFKNKVQMYLQNKYLVTTFKDYEMSIRDFSVGSPAFDFGGKDVNGNEHKLSDYKGNLVYVDVWATWCGPCKQEIPAMKELEKKFHGQPITFMSISIDKPEDREKWMDYVKSEQLTGVQVMAENAFDSDVARAYEIHAIPRFMLFDKKGNIVTVDAPRPSAPNTEQWLKDNLK